MPRCLIDLDTGDEVDQESVYEYSVKCLSPLDVDKNTPSPTILKLNGAFVRVQQRRESLSFNNSLPTIQEGDDDDDDDDDNDDDFLTIQPVKENQTDKEVEDDATCDDSISDDSFLLSSDAPVPQTIIGGNSTLTGRLKLFLKFSSTTSRKQSNIRKTTRSWFSKTNSSSSSNDSKTLSSKQQQQQQQPVLNNIV